MINTKIIEYKVLCTSKTTAHIANKTIFRKIDNLPTEKFGFVFEKYTPRISMPPAQPLLLNVRPIPNPPTIAPKITLESTSSITGVICLGRRDNVNICTTTLKSVLKQNSLEMERNANINKGIFNAMLMIPVKSKDTGTLTKD